MSDNQERPQQLQEGAAVKVDQIRNIQGGTLVRTISAGQPARFMMTPVQSSALISTTTTIQAQVLPKGTVPGTRLSAIPVATSTTGYHVPRGAAAVASIAVPRASVATPIVRATGQQLQAIGVAPPQAIASASSGSIVGRSVVGVTPWMTACLPQNPQRQQQPSIRPPMTTTKLVSGQIRPVSDGQTRPVLLHSTTTKQVTLTQQAQVQVAGEKVLKSYGGASQGARLVTPVSTPPLSRIATSLPPMVSLHPAVLVSNNSSLPIKATTTQAKVIAQPAHGTTMQFTPVPASSVQPAIAINSVVARPGLVTVMLTSGTPQMSGSSTITRLPHPSKTEGIPQSAFVHAQPAKPVQATLVRDQRPQMKEEPSVTTSNSIVSLSNTVYTFSGNTYFDSQISRNSTSFLTTQPSTSSNSQGGNQNVRPVMVVDTSRSSYIPPPDGNSSSTDSSSSVSTLTAQNLPTKPTTSPRPSILRKRDPIESSPMKGQKNLTPVLASMGVSAGSPPGPGSPKRPESGHSGQSSAGSTTISANSSPGESPTIKQEVNEDEPPRLQTVPVAPQTEMSPRKKPRKQQLTGNQINEATYSDNEMEFISEDKIKREIKDEPIFEEEKSVPKKNMSLINVKSKDDRKPTLSELANQKNALKKIEGWKVHHLVTQIEDTSNAEGEYLEIFSYFLTMLEGKKCKNKEFEKDLLRVIERIKANQQRSKVVKDQMNEAKTQVLKIFDQKEKVAEIISKNITKRTIKKRERL